MRGFFLHAEKKAESETSGIKKNNPNAIIYSLV